MSKCKRCGIVLDVPDENQKKKYCSNQCRRSEQKERYAVLNDRANISPGKVGAVAELIVSADLLRKGYEVFRSVSQDCSCDLVILKAGRFIRVEVRTGYVNTDGSVGYAKKPSDVGRSDATAIVLRGRDVVYSCPIDDA